MSFWDTGLGPLFATRVVIWSTRARRTLNMRAKILNTIFQDVTLPKLTVNFLIGYCHEVDTRSQLLPHTPTTFLMFNTLHSFEQTPESTRVCIRCPIKSRRKVYLHYEGEKFRVCFLVRVAGTGLARPWLNSRPARKHVSARVPCSSFQRYPRRFPPPRGHFLPWRAVQSMMNWLYGHICPNPDTLSRI